jgi:fucose 4-O-acetylase-like acetyltransferase
MVTGMPEVSRQRVEWIDAVRGVGILLVVFGHGWRGLYEAGILRDQARFEAIDAAVYLFHMPLFFLLSGVGAGLAFPRRDVFGHALSQTVRLMYPLVLWTYIFSFLRFMTGDAANHVIDLQELLAPPLPPRYHFWFLWTLAVIALASVALFWFVSAVFGGDRRVLAVFALASVPAASLALTAIGGNPTLDSWIGTVFRDLPIYLIGAVVGAYGFLRPSFAAALFGAAIFVALEAALAAGLFDRAEPRIAGHLAAGAAMVGLAYLFSRAPGAMSASFAWLGRNSLAVFLAHTIFSAAMRMLLMRLGVSDPVIHLTLGFLIGVAGPIMLLAVARRLRIGDLLGFDGVPLLSRVRPAHNR